MKKKLGAVLATTALAGAIALSMTATGCRKPVPEFNMPDEGYDGSEVTIMFYNTMGQTLRSVLESDLARFKELYPNITVNYDSSFGDYDTLRTQIVNEISSFQEPNVAFCYPDHVADYNESGVVLCLDDFLPTGAFKNMTVTNSKGTEPMGFSKDQLDDFIEPYLDEGRSFGDGKLYTLPLAKSTELLYYNKTFFEAHKDKISEPTAESTWDDIFATCKIIKEQIDPECIPLGIDSEANLFITMCEQLGTPYTSSTGEHYRFVDKRNKEFVQKFKDWYLNDHLFITETINKSYTSNLFKEQTSYLSIGSSAGAQYQTPEFKDGSADFEVGIVPIPQANPAKPKSISQGPSICIFKKDNPQEVIASWLFVKFMTTDLRAQSMYSMASGYVPVIKSVFEDSIYSAHLGKASGYSDGVTALAAKTCKTLLDMDAFYTSPAFSGSSKAREQVEILMVAAITGAKTIDKAFSDAYDECKYFTL